MVEGGNKDLLMSRARSEKNAKDVAIESSANPTTLREALNFQGSDEDFLSLGGLDLKVRKFLFII